MQGQDHYEATRLDKQSDSREPGGLFNIPNCSDMQSSQDHEALWLETICKIYWFATTHVLGTSHAM